MPLPEIRLGFLPTQMACSVHRERATAPASRLIVTLRALRREGGQDLAIARPVDQYFASVLFAMATMSTVG